MGIEDWYSEWRDHMFDRWSLEQLKHYEARLRMLLSCPGEFGELDWQRYVDYQAVTKERRRREKR